MNRVKQPGLASHGREPALGLYDALGIAMSSLYELLHSIFTIKIA